MFHEVNKVKIHVLKFSKWKFEIQYFQSIETFTRSIKMVRKSILESLPISIDAWFLFNRSKGTLDWLKLIKLNFLKNFLVTVLKVWRSFKHCKRLFGGIFWLLGHVFSVGLVTLLGLGPVWRVASKTQHWATWSNG